MLSKHLNAYLNKRRITYKQYLESEHWRDVRSRFWSSKLHDGRCYACGASKHLQVHHKTYKRIGDERLNDLCLLCDDCHVKTHEIAKESPKRRGLFRASKVLRKALGVRHGQHVGGKKQ